MRPFEAFSAINTEAVESDSHNFAENEIAEDPRACLKENSYEDEENPVPEAGDFLNEIDLSDFIDRKLDDQETRNLLQAEIEKFTEQRRKLQQEMGYRADFGSELETEYFKKIIEMNRRDAQRIKEIVEYIKFNRASNEGSKKIKNFWKKFEDIFNEKTEVRSNGYEKKENKRNKHCKYGTPARIKSGILGELAADELLGGLKDFFLDPKNIDEDFEGIDFSAIGIEVRDSTPEEDALLQTDLKLKISYMERAFDLPVQVKCKYLHNNNFEFAEKKICLFSRHGIDPQDPYEGKNIKRFFKKFGKGAFLVLPYDNEKLKIDDYGFPSNRLKQMFYEKAAKEIYLFLKNNL